MQCTLHVVYSSLVSSCYWGTYMYITEEVGHAYASCEVMHAHTYIVYARSLPYTPKPSWKLLKVSGWLMVHQTLLRAGVPLALSKHCSPTAELFFVGHTTDVAEYDCGDDCCFLNIFNALVHRNQGGALVCNGTNLK